MKNDINLITQAGSPRRVYNKLFLYTAVLFGIVFAIALSLTVYSFILKTQAGKLAEDVATARNRIASMADVRQKILTVSERIGAAKKIVSKRQSLEFQTSQILSSIPNNFSIDTINASDDIVTVTLASSNLLAFDDFFEVQLTDLYRREDLSLKKIESTSFTRSGNYELTLDFYFADAAKQ